MTRGQRLLLLSLVPLLAVGVFMVQLGSLGNMFFPPNSPYSDLVLTHWPNAFFFQQSITQDHAWPLWNPNQMIGVPFAANPLSGLWYPPNWLFVLFPITEGFNLLLAAHICFGGVGMMLLARRLGFGAFAMAVSGLGWALGPKTWAHLGAGHVSLVFASAWVPWVIDAAVLQTRRPRAGSLTWLSGTWALQFLADPRLATFTAVGALGVALWSLTRTTSASATGTREPVTRGREGYLAAPVRWVFSRWRPALSWIAAGSLGLGLTAVQWIPLLAYLPDTTRYGLTVSEGAVYSLPPARLMGLFWADRGGFHEWMVYSGVSILVVVLFGWLCLPRRELIWSGVGFALVVVLALGDQGPLFSIVARMPGLSLLRVPPRIWFLMSFGLALLAGLGVDAVLYRPRCIARFRRGLNRLGVAAIGAAVLFALVAWWQDLPMVDRFAYAALWLGLAISVCFLAQRRWMPTSVAGVALFLLIAVELIWMDSSLVTSRAAEDSFTAGWETAISLAEREGRVYTPSFRPSPPVLALNGIRAVNGVEPLKPADYATLLNMAAGIPERDEYSITLPPLPQASGEIALDVGMALSEAIPSARLLALLDADTVVSEFQLHSPGLVELSHIESEELFVYSNQSDIVWPAVFTNVESVPDIEAALDWLRTAKPEDMAVVIDGRPLSGLPGNTPAQVVQGEPNRLVISAVGPGLLVVSELFSPGWRATVDGEMVEVVAADGVLRGVYLDGGRHLVEMVYRPASVIVGAIASGGSLVVWLVLGLTARRDARGRSE